MNLFCGLISSSVHLSVRINSIPTFLGTALNNRTDMVLFFCTFLALRSQDCGRPVDRIRDYELDDEEELFGGYECCR